VLTVRDLRVAFGSGRRAVQVVRGVDFEVRPGEVLGVVGESGSGKSVTSLAVMGLLPPTATVTGSVRLCGRELLGLPDRELAAQRGRVISMVFQDPLSALTPVYRVGDQIAEAVRAHGRAGRARAAARAVALLDLVGIADPARTAQAFPHELSGGMRQRVVIAMAIANDPAVIICDEPTTSLDVTVQAQVLDVLRRARAETGAAIILITHDLGVVAGLADRVLVMYAGRAVETGSVEDAYYRPRMPYTRGLLDSVPRIEAGGAPPPTPIEGAPPSLAALPSGCPFQPRCRLAVRACVTAEPPLMPVGPGHLAACLRTADTAAPADSAARDPLTAEPAVGEPVTADPVAREPDTAEPGSHERASHESSACEPATRERRVHKSTADASAAEASAAEANDVEGSGAEASGVENGAEAGFGGLPVRGLCREHTSAARAGRPVVLQVEELAKHYPVTRGVVFRRRIGTIRAVDGLSFDVREGETLALVGESGCGKTTTLLEILELARPQGGRVTVLGRDTANLGSRDRVAIRRDLQVVFQDPIASLDPRMTVHDIIAEPLRTHRVHPVWPRVAELLGLVGLDESDAARYPADLSGGQRQRVGIARALALSPRLVVMDEPVSALDMSIRAGVINLLADLKRRLGLSYLLVAHDLAVVRHVADRVAVMYLGRIAEIGRVDAVYETPKHPYTRALLSAIPVPDPRVERARRRVLLDGDLPSPAGPPGGCRFRGRCPAFKSRLTEGERSRCVEEEPAVLPFGDDHGASCHYAERLTFV
jgi:peptide/nickel transport system ATP-binding protein